MTNALNLFTILIQERTWCCEDLAWVINSTMLSCSRRCKRRLWWPMHMLVCVLHCYQCSLIC